MDKLRRFLLWLESSKYCFAQFDAETHQLSEACFEIVVKDYTKGKDY